MRIILSLILVTTLMSCVSASLTDEDILACSKQASDNHSKSMTSAYDQVYQSCLNKKQVKRTKEADNKNTWKWIEFFTRMLIPNENNTN